MDILAPFIRHISYPLWMIREGEKGILKYLKYFEYIDDLNRSDLEKRQETGLKDILIHAYENTTYYRRQFDESDFNPYDMRSKEEIMKIPILTKDIVRNHYSELAAKNIDEEQITEASTGGSTGTPMIFLRDKESIYLRKGQELYFDRWMGYRIGEKIAFFVAASHFDGTVDRLKAKIKNATLERMLRFDPHNITDGYMEDFARQYVRFKPSMIKCFPNSLTAFAEFIKRKGIELPPVRSISCTGENLYERQRRLFEETFGGEVFEKVGTRESGVFACECRMHKGLHVFSEGVLLEILDNNGRPAQPGGLGRVIITDLFNKAMPLIRYEIGDMAMVSDGRNCECGNPLPLIEKLLGRDRDIIVDSYGNPKPGYLFTEIILEMNISAQFQVVQKTRDSLLVKIVNKDAENVEIERVKEEFQEIVGPLVRIDVQFVSEIPRDPSGKYGYVVSKVSQ
jgi:phenylacetate-CoA ligase